MEQKTPEILKIPEVQVSKDGTEKHEPPRGALLITVFYLLLLTALWANVYLTLLLRGVPQS